MEILKSEHRNKQLCGGDPARHASYAFLDSLFICDIKVLSPVATLNCF